VDPEPRSGHLDVERLLAEDLDEREREHLERCVRCRSERRVRRAPTVGPAPRLGPYEVLGEIGAGGMGRVYLAWHPDQKVKRAIKVLTLESKSARERFLREACAQRRVSHDNVLSVLGMLELPEGPALVLPYVAGPNLATLLLQHRPSQNDVFALFRELCSGVAAIHEARLVHRDLTPNNVLLDPSGDVLTVRVADFGLVKVLADSTAETLTRSGMRLGTRAYMAPEQHLDPKRIDARADVWSLGAILYEMLCGRPPKDLWALQVPEIPQWGVLLKEMLSSDPSGRPADATVVLSRLPPTESIGAELSAVSRRLVPLPVAASGLDMEQARPEVESTESSEPSLGRSFAIQGLIGAGGFGEVYRATMQSPGGLRQDEDVAVKFLRDPDPRALARLEREGELLASLHHPSILRVYDLVRLQGQVALVTEYVAGMDLTEALRSVPPLPARAVLDTVSLVAEALHAASAPQVSDAGESRSLVHRDIKPSNIRIGVHGEVKLLDFGVAWSGNRDSTHGDSFIGSVPYMAPERFLRQRAQPAGDVYALGCVLYEGLAGRPLHMGEDTQEIFAHANLLAREKELHDRFIEEALARLEPAEPACRLLREMLSFHPDDRPVARQVAASCDVLREQVDGKSLKQWCRGRTWTSIRTRQGPLTGLVLKEASGEGVPGSVESTFQLSGPRATRFPRGWVLGLVGLVGVCALLLWQLLPRTSESSVPTPVHPSRSLVIPPVPPPAPPPEPPRPTPVPGKRPKPPPVPKPPPPEPPLPIEVPAPGRFDISGDFAQVQLRDRETGAVFLPGEVPVGSYEVYAQFNGEWVVMDLPVSVASRQRVVIFCNQVRWTCKPQ
jgi:serine/threonine protein kinase